MAVTCLVCLLCCLSVCPSVRPPSARPPVRRSDCLQQSACRVLPACLSVSVCLLSCLSVSLSPCLSVSLSLCRSVVVFVSVRRQLLSLLVSASVPASLTVCPPLLLSSVWLSACIICLSVCLVVLVCLSVCLPVCLSDVPRPRKKHRSARNVRSSPQAIWHS